MALITFLGMDLQQDFFFYHIFNNKKKKKKTKNFFFSKVYKLRDVCTFHFFKKQIIKVDLYDYFFLKKNF